MNAVTRFLIRFLSIGTKYKISKKHRKYFVLRRYGLFFYYAHDLDLLFWPQLLLGSLGLLLHILILLAYRPMLTGSLYLFLCHVMCIAGFRIMHSITYLEGYSFTTLKDALMWTKSKGIGYEDIGIGRRDF